MPQKLGPTQEIVLLLLAGGERSARDISRDGFGVTEKAASAALDRLGRRSLVDRGHRYGELRYWLTTKGHEVVDAMCGDGDTDDALDDRV